MHDNFVTLQLITQLMEQNRSIKSNYQLDRYSLTSYCMHVFYEKETASFQRAVRTCRDIFYLKILSVYQMSWKTVLLEIWNGLYSIPEKGRNLHWFLFHFSSLSILNEITQGESTIHGIMPIRHLLYTILECLLGDKHNDHCTAWNLSSPAQVLPGRGYLCVDVGSLSIT